LSTTARATELKRVLVLLGGYAPGPRALSIEEEAMRIEVDYDACEANALCMREAPDVFEVDDNDNLHVHEENITEARREQIKKAALVCPKQAIKVFD
jgi:ferredoxin